MKRITPSTKRKIAAFIAIILVVVMVLGLIAPFLSFRTAYAAESQQFAIEAQMGFNGSIKIEKKAPVYIKVTNNSGTTFNGRASIVTQSVDSYNTQKIEFFSELELAAGETKEIRGMVPVNTIEFVYTVKLIDKHEKVVAEKALNVATDRNDSVWIAILSDEHTTANEIGGKIQDYSYQLGASNVCEITPQDTSSLDNFNMLIINDFDIDNADSETLENIYAWLSNGGMLMLGTSGDIPNSIRGWVSEYQGKASSVDPSEKENAINLLRDAAVNAGASYDEFNDLYDILTVDEALKAASVLATCSNTGDLSFKDDFMDILNESIYGDRQYLSRSINDSYDSLCSKYKGDSLLCDYYTNPPFNGEKKQVDFEIYKVGENGSLYTMPKETITDDILYTGLSKNSFNLNNVQRNRNFYLERPTDYLGTLFLGIIMIYSIMVGPLLYAILKKKDKKDAAVKYIPLSALALTAVIIVCSLGSNFQRPMVSVMNMVNASSGGTKPMEGYALCSAPTKGKLHIVNDSIKNAYIASKDNYEKQSCRIAFDKLDYTKENSTKWEQTSFTYTSNIELSGALTVKADQNSSPLKLTITNNTGYDLEDICVSNGDSYSSTVYAAKKLANGESIEYVLDSYTNSNYLTPNIRSKYSQLEINKRQAAEYYNGNSIGTSVKVTGFTSGYTQGDFKINGRKAGVKQSTAFYTIIDVI